MLRTIRYRWGFPSRFPWLVRIPTTRHFRYARARTLEFSAGKPFEDVFDAALGAQVASALGYNVGDSIVIDHGIGSVGVASHTDKPFRVSGILKRTGTPVDQTVHVSLAGIEAIHIDWRSGRPMPGLGIDAERVRQMNRNHGHNGPSSACAFRHVQDTAAGEHLC